jgi:hypothetical protein
MVAACAAEPSVSAWGGGRMAERQHASVNLGECLAVRGGLESAQAPPTVLVDITLAVAHGRR